ncbi:DoxX family protein [Sphingomonas sp. M1-B02]|uniref:DoxX family protein n=1 Tax=Sphingomonas sp. M1-B02 TaxID=3114300 RepID=UPI002240A79B|nr:DoxX family protein [Sphingomonas sp. S6-11]UZK64737.1 DoxX family protein [Sphingomonas sp. S6-11]
MSPQAMTIGGWSLSGLLILFLMVDMGMKFALLQPVIDAHAQLGWPSDAATIRILAAILLIATALYAFPRTSLLGAILITAYLGGAVATHARISSPLFTHTLFGVYIGVLLWAGLWLRDARLRDLLPLST